MRNTTVRSSQSRALTKPLNATELETLEHFRLECRWTYRQLAESISSVTELRMPEPTLIRALTKAVPSRLRLTTVYPLRKYLAWLKTPQAAATMKEAVRAERAS
jgi:hypothetical protein